MIVRTGNDEDRLRKRVRAEQRAGVEFCGRINDAQREAASFGIPLLGRAGTVTEELFPTGTGAVLAKDLSRESIAEAAIPV